MDAAVAVLVGAVILATIVSGNYRTSLEPASQAKVLAESSLASLDSSGLLSTIAGQSDAEARASLYGAQQALIPGNLGSNVTVFLYNYTTAGSCPASCQLGGASPVNGLCLCRILSSNTTANYSQSDAVTAAARVFYSQDYAYYGLAAIEVYKK